MNRLQSDFIEDIIDDDWPLTEAYEARTEKTTMDEMAAAYDTLRHVT